LRQIADSHARLHETAAGIGIDLAVGYSEQRRLAGAVAADEAQPLGRADREARALEQWGAAERKTDILEEEQRRRCHDLL
jgi:hypothetical protein